MNRFTPGPWHVSELDRRTVGPIRVLRAEGTTTDLPQMQAVATVKVRLVDAETDANACLIAAAPELLDGIKAMVSLYDLIQRTSLGASVRDKLARAEAAIAKAEGRQV